MMVEFARVVKIGIYDTVSSSHHLLEFTQRQYLYTGERMIIIYVSVLTVQVDQFLNDLVTFNKEEIHENNLKAIDPYLQNKDFDADFVRNKSFAAAGLCAWAINIVSFYRVFCDVEPKRKALAAANAQLKEAQDKLAKIKKKIKVRFC